MTEDRTLIFIPTYNESENIQRLYELILGLHSGIEILFLDDNSPDGTGMIADNIAKYDSAIHVIHRPLKMGIGSAHLEGIDFAYKHNYKTLITMDSDFSHDPRDIVKFQAVSKEYDLVIGTRFVEKGSLDEWKLSRKVITHTGHFITKALLRMPYDASGAFRLYRLERIKPYLFKMVKANGYSFFPESLYILFLNGIRVKEIPIKLPKRCYGDSKMTLRDICKGVISLFAIYMKSETSRYPLLVGKNSNDFSNL